MLPYVAALFVGFLVWCTYMKTQSDFRRTKSNSLKKEADLLVRARLVVGHIRLSYFVKHLNGEPGGLEKMKEIDRLIDFSRKISGWGFRLTDEALFGKEDMEEVGRFLRDAKRCFAWADEVCKEALAHGIEIPVSMLDCSKQEREGAKS